MSKKSLELKIGIFILAAFTLLGIMLFVSGRHSIFKKGYSIRTSFSFVSGLNENAPVRLAGFIVGSVREIKLVEGKVLVTLWLEEGQKIYKDSKITINSLGLIGERYVEISQGTAAAGVAKAGELLPGEDPVSIAEIISRAEVITRGMESSMSSVNQILASPIARIYVDEILKNTRNLTEVTNEILSKNKDKISDSVDKLQHSSDLIEKSAMRLSSDYIKISDTINKTVDKNKESLDQSALKLKKWTDSLASSSDTLFDRINKTSAALTSMVVDNKADFNTTMKNIKNFSESLNDISDTFAVISAMLSKKDTTLGRIMTDKEMGDKFGKLVNNLYDLSVDVKQHPWKLLKKD